MNEAQPEEIMRQVLALEKELKQIKSRTERPIPVVRDRQGRLAKDLTLKEWFAKIDEEVNEVKEAVLRIYDLRQQPGILSESEKIPLQDKDDIAEEICDVIKVLYSMSAQMGIDGDDLDRAMHECNEKTRRRGCHE
jgi:NTP pyrophosphatase (non-canonical NTP hydrolase)